MTKNTALKQYYGKKFGLDEEWLMKEKGTRKI